MLVLAAFATVLDASPGAAQSVGELQRQIQESRTRLEQLRQERARLEARLAETQEGAADVSAELANVERRLSASRSVLAELELQFDAVTTQSETTTRALLEARDQLALARARLDRRLRSAYQLGPLSTVRALLSARSISELLSRYRYLARLAELDQALIERVLSLEADLDDRRAALSMQRTELAELRGRRNREVSELRRVEDERQSALARLRTEERQARSRLEQIEADEARLTGLVDELERLRLAAERARAAAGEAALPTTLGAADAGTLDWPTDGDLIYRFGREQRPNGLVLRWNGVGIAAQPGTPVQAVRDGTVVLAGPFQGYGPTVVLSHGGGFYTLYLYLDELAVVEGRTVRAGQTLGTVGGSDTPEGPHLEFQIRTPAEDGSPVARDPLEWLRPRGG